MQDTYGDKVRIVFRDFPLAMHPFAQLAAEAAQCARAQGKFWEYHDKLFANQQALGKDQLKQYAKDLGLVEDTFNACIETGKSKDAIAEDQKEGERFGVTGTPALGRKVSSRSFCKPWRSNAAPARSPRGR